MGLLKAVGKFLRYSNQNQLYFLTETIELVSNVYRRDLELFDYEY